MVILLVLLHLFGLCKMPGLWEFIFFFCLMSSLMYVLSCFLYSYFTNTLILPVINGPTEGLMLIYVAHLFTAFVGIVLSLLIPILTFLDHLSMHTNINLPTDRVIDLIIRMALFPGAEWWAQPFGKSIPLFSWLPFINGKSFN